MKPARAASDDRARQPRDGAGLAPGSTLGPTRRASCDIATRLVARPAQSGFQFLLLLCPARVLRLRPSVECGAVSFDFFDLGFMLTLRFFKRCFGRCDCLLAPLAFPLPRGLFLAALAIAPLPFSVKRKGSLACCLRRPSEPAVRLSSLEALLSSPSPCRWGVPSA